MSSSIGSTGTSRPASRRAASSGTTSLRKSPSPVSTLARIFAHSGCAIQRIQLEREVPVGLIVRRLLRDHHVRKLRVEERVVPACDVAQGDGEIALLLGDEVGQAPQPVPARPDRHFEGPPRRERDGYDEALVRGDDAVGTVVGLRRRAGETASLTSAVAVVGL